jgi:hypothetical protein
MRSSRLALPLVDCRWSMVPSASVLSRVFDLVFCQRYYLCNNYTIFVTLVNLYSLSI